MARRIEALSNVIVKYRGATIPLNIQHRIDGMVQAIEQQRSLIEAKIPLGLDRILDDSNDAQDVMDCLRSISFLVDVFERTRWLHGRHPRRYPRRSPRVGDRSTEPIGVYWLSGMAGAGKTSIARSFAHLLASTRINRFGGSFLCARASGARSDAHRIFPTLAHHLARRDVGFRNAVVNSLEGGLDDDIPASWPLKTQFVKLIVVPSAAVSILDGPMVFVIDGLDECSDPGAVRNFLSVLVQPIHHIKIFITTRPERHIQPVFGLEIQQPRRFRLQDIEMSIVAADVAKYLAAELMPVSGRLNVAGWPSPTELARLVERTGQLFLFAFMAVQYLSVDDLSDSDTRLRLQKLLAVNVATSVQTAIIDNLYAQIFSAAYAQKEPNEVLTLRLALDSIICLREPLTLSAISDLVGLTPKDLQNVLGHFRSVIDIPSSFAVPVVLFHSSFAEYVRTSARSRMYAMDAIVVHQKMAFMCVRCMNTLLHPHMRGITETTSTSQISKADIHSDALQYACLHWVAHLVALSPSDAETIMDALQTFTRSHLLQWLECLIVMDQINVAVQMLHSAIDFIQACHLPEIQAVMEDARYMIPQVAKFVQHSPVQLYSSALDWLPETSPLRKVYAHRPPRVLGGLEQQLVQRPSGSYPDACSCVSISAHGLIVSTDRHHSIVLWDVARTDKPKNIFGGNDGWIRSLAFSPSGVRVVAGYHDFTIGIWSVETEAMEHRLVGHTSVVHSAKFSPDGAWIVSGSNDNTVCIWNADTGSLKLRLDGHESWVGSAVFSPDGSKIASGSGDRTVRLWNAETGEPILTFTGHSGGVYSVAFSPDRFHFASGSEDNTIGIWSTVPGIPPRRLVGHSGGVFAVNFSPDGSRICSGSGDGALRIWDFSMGSLQMSAKGDGRLHSAEFSQNGAHIVTASDGRSLFLRDAFTGKTVWNNFNVSAPTYHVTASPTAVEVHSAAVKSIIFSSDGTLVASGCSQGTVRVWRMDTGRAQWIFKPAGDLITTLAFSADGLHLAAGVEVVRLDLTASVEHCPVYGLICIWNLSSGQCKRVVELVVPPSCATFSSDGLFLVAVVGFWRAAAGSTTLLSIAVSPDGRRIATGFSDGSVAIYTLEGKQLQHCTDPQQDGHSLAFLSFSPTGLDLLCGFRAPYGDTGRSGIWSIETGILQDLSDVVFGTLSDGSRFACAYPGHLQIQDLSLDPDGFICAPTQGQDGPAFVLASPGKQVRDLERLQIWLDYQRDIASSAFHGTRVALGYWSGRVLLVDMAAGGKIGDLTASAWESQFSVST
ncbi:WD40-repeat-containing domain protein [Mycena olivaceomarginata]|nr:WD40-repeat-containing domain protein [Mycena olivaceomarginata]